MIDITHKSSSLRSATAQAVVTVGSPETIVMLHEGRIPKGNVLETARTAGLFAAKRTADMIPDCHPLPVEETKVNYEVDETSIKIEVFVKTIYKTGVEVEAMHAASVVALTIYDMLKPVDKEIVIGDIKLLKKTGGKSSRKRNPNREFEASVIVCSDSISQGIKEDRAGKAIIEKLGAMDVKTEYYTIIPDEVDLIQKEVLERVDKNSDLIIVTGGTGLSPRDVTPEALKPIIEREVPGMSEAIRSYGQERTPYAMLSRSIVGTIGSSLVLGLPGSTNGAKESIDALFPHALHLFEIFKGAQHT